MTSVRARQSKRTARATSEIDQAIQQVTDEATQATCDLLEGGSVDMPNFEAWLSRPISECRMSVLEFLMILRRERRLGGETSGENDNGQV